MYNYFHRMATDIFPYAANVSKVVEACLTYGCDMMFHWYECIIQKIPMFLATDDLLITHLKPKLTLGEEVGED